MIYSKEKCLKHFLPIIILVSLSMTACVPKLQQDASTTASGFTDKTLERKLASESAENNFNALTVSMNVRIGDREYIQNVFEDVFGPSARALVKSFIMAQGMALNGGCSQYEAVYADPVTAGLSMVIDDDYANCGYSVYNLPIIGTENSIREGLRIQACEKVVSTTATLFYLIDSVTGVTNVQTSAFATNPTDEHIKNIYNRFYPGQTIPADVLLSLKQIVNSSAVTTSTNRFNLVALTICMSADWQIP
jgi:peptidoglycan hydrolase-like protein with peptidoglycan-binding domain